MNSSKDGLTVELHALRDRVVGVTDVRLATADGIRIAADADQGSEVESLAALTAAALGLARRTGEATGKGALRQ